MSGNHARTAVAEQGRICYNIIIIHTIIYVNKQPQTEDVGGVIEY